MKALEVRKLVCFKQIATVAHSVSAVTTDYRFTPYTDWIPCTGIDAFRVAFKLKSVKGNFDCIPAYQFAEVRKDDPRATINTFGTARTTNGSSYAEVDISGTTAQKSGANLYVRLGISAKTGASEGWGIVELSAAYEQCGRMVADLPGQQIETYKDDTTTKVLPVTGWLPTAGLSSYKAAFIFNGNGASEIQYTLCYRTAASDRTEPGVWTGLGSYHTNGAANEEHVIVDTTWGTALDDKMWVQIGVVYRGTSSTSVAYSASISPAVAVRS